MGEAQTAAYVLMIRPVRFASNPQTASSNLFQQQSGGDRDLQARARGEFDTLAETLRAANVGVVIFDDTPEPHTPDAIFPNNWVSFHADGSVLLYPMLAPNRRLERRPELLDALAKQHGFYIERVIDLAHFEASNCYLEGTGSLVLDRINRLAYACLSLRTHPAVLIDFARQRGYELVTFEAHDAAGAPIYHTNVMLAIGRRFAVVCAASVTPSQRSPLLQRLEASGRTVIELTHHQMQAFAGNILELRTQGGTPLIAMSEQARRALTARQQSLLEDLGGRIVSSAIPTIERIGGGSVRCMLAEIHLPRIQ